MSTNGVPVAVPVAISSPTWHQPSDGFDKLTMREQEVLALIGEGCSTREIAARLKISFKTAACHRSHILTKFGVHNSVTLVRYAIRKGLIQP